MIISPILGNDSYCSGQKVGYNYKELVVEVEDDKSLVIQDGPFVSDELCSGLPGTLIIDVLDSENSTIEFRYGTIENNKRMNSNRIDEDTYEVFILEPDDSSYLFVINDKGCGKIVQLNLGIGTPSFDYTSVSYEQNGNILANEIITFKNESTQPFTRWIWDFGDGTIEEFPKVRDLKDNDGDGWSNYIEDITGSDKDDPNIVPEDLDVNGIADNLSTSQQDITHEYNISGTYYVNLRIFNTLGCYEDISQPITIGKGYYVLKPNVFTPFASEGVNDNFYVLISGFVNYNFSIYDYRGNLMYSEADEEDDPLNPVGLNIVGWDGAGGQSENTSYSIEQNGSPYYVFVLQGTLLKNYDTEPRTVSETGTFILLN